MTGGQHANTAGQNMSGDGRSKAPSKNARSSEGRRSEAKFRSPAWGILAVTYGLILGMIYFLGSPLVMFLFLIKVLDEMCSGKWKKAARSIVLCTLVPLWVPLVVMRRGYRHIMSGRPAEFALDEF